MVWQDVVNLPTMTRAVASRRRAPRNEDLAIVIINPILGNVLDFVVDEILSIEILRTKGNEGLECSAVCHCSLPVAHSLSDRHWVKPRVGPSVAVEVACFGSLLARSKAAA